jgi:hypothetical protein
VLLCADQVVAQLGEVYQIDYPPAYQGIINVLQVLTFKLTKLLPVLPLQCLSPDLRDQLLFVLLAPLAIVAVVVASVGGAIAARSQDRASLSAASLLLPALPFVLVWTFIVLPPVSSIAFRALASCECFEYAVPRPGTDETEVCFLSTDRNVVCESYGGVYHAPPRVIGAAVATVVVWAGGVPLMYGWLLYAARAPLAQRAPPTALSRQLIFLTDGFKPRFFWWQLVDIARKLVLVGFLALVEPGSLLQQFIAVVVSLCFFAIELYIVGSRESNTVGTRQPSTQNIPASRRRPPTRSFARSCLTSPALRSC